MQELTFEQVETLGGAGFMEGAGAAGLALGIGTTTFGGSFCTIGVIAAFGAAPLAAGAMVGLAFYAGYQMLQ
ncbi:hypothetical protein [Rheinheimera sp. MMS21-TC3]|uniref:hypothetical protein n=1 Tax=Rheinheimera sp. MMS21-TC3 TaxID=3072790 RepID=UPI0028C467AB|nr:hypothetical protein [Rheinheimera sp. MMS21-TC3]WNO59772.1 hypothetical protein RDV63_02080 [Rheinheimera sp. MMS21-TC3]